MTYRAVMFLVTQQFSISESRANPFEIDSALKRSQNLQHFLDSFFFLHTGSTETLIVLSRPV
jgi:hypothetical protein